jgi:hypothetical protein
MKIPEPMIPPITIDTLVHKPSVGTSARGCIRW